MNVKKEGERSKGLSLAMKSNGAQRRRKRRRKERENTLGDLASTLNI